MARSTYGAARNTKKAKIRKKTKGYRGARGNLWRQSKHAALRADIYATRDRRKKKGDFRRLWITRISAAIRSFDISYSRFINGLKRANIEIDRKNLSELAIHSPDAFAEIVNKAKEALAA